MKTALALLALPIAAILAACSGQVTWTVTPPEVVTASPSTSPTPWICPDGSTPDPTASYNPCGIPEP
jgi:hypothetical protein